MKKINILVLISIACWLCCLSSWCNKQQETEQEFEQEYVVGFSYDNKMEVEGISPLVQYWWALDDWTLVLKKGFEDHTDILFFIPWIREDIIGKDWYALLPGNTLYFDWEVELIDWAAWSHYYKVTNINELSFSEYANKEKIIEIFSWYKSCFVDSDCWMIIPWCPLWCYIPINKKYIDISNYISKNFIAQQKNQCDYKCIAVGEPYCNENYVCDFKDIEKTTTTNNGLNKANIIEVNQVFN